MPQMGQALSQRLEQRMSQNQIQSLDLLAMAAIELRERISKELMENPALEPAVRSSPKALLHTADRLKNIPFQNERKTPYFSSEASDSFQTFLENLPAPQTQSLQKHLLEQLFFQQLDTPTTFFAERIIENLTSDGFHAVPLADLFNKERSSPLVRQKMRRALSIVRRLDPIGCATRDFKQSLLIQAKILFYDKTTVDPVYAYAIDILEHHFSYLEKARPYSLAHAVNENTSIPYKLTQENAEDILSLIASLNPFPGRAFSADTVSEDYIVPTAFIEQNDREFAVKINSLEVPLLTISPELQKLSHHTEDAAAKMYIKEQIQKAKVFIGSLNQREKTIVSVLRKVVSVQEAFFFTGDIRRLMPLTQQQIAEELNIHESTVSRTVSGKYLQCRWGVFEIKFFFTNSIPAQPSRAVSNSPSTKEGVKACIRDLLTGQTTKLSDQKISDILREKYGVSVARRTVAKYRKELDIGSSYNRF